MTEAALLFYGACWEWPGLKSPEGYGRSFEGGAYAHRMLYEAAKGPISPGMQIDHLCRNRACCNPDHLQQLTQQENIRRGMLARTHCKNGHEWTDANTYVRPDTGTRQCRPCHTGRRRCSSCWTPATRLWESQGMELCSDCSDLAASPIWVTIMEQNRSNTPTTD